MAPHPGTVPAPPPRALAPTKALALRNWWRGADYNATTGDWPATAGSVATTLVQTVAGKRPSKNTSNAAFGNFATVNADGVDDDLRRASGAALAVTPNAIGILTRHVAGGAANYLIGTYTTSGYQFHRWDEASDWLYGDPGYGGGNIVAANINGVHLWGFDRVGTALSIYKDGVLVGSRTQGSGTAPATDFHLFSAGAGYSAGECAELMTFDASQGALRWRQLAAYFRGLGYPLA